MKKLLFPIVLVALLLASCKGNDDDNNKQNSDEYKTIDRSIYEIMQYVYLWNNDLPKYKKNECRYPEEFFTSLLSEEDPWSFISDDSETTIAEIEGEQYSTGIIPMFVRYDENNLALYVTNVYPDSPADKAGIKHGDLILEINGKELTIDNYYDLYMENNPTYLLGIYNAQTNQIDDGELVSVLSTTIDSDPSIFDTVLDVDGRAVGYYVFVEYTDNKEHKNHIDKIFDKFREAGVKDLILDLRYNGGGSVGMAQHLISNIAPISAVDNKDVIINEVFNSILSREYSDEDKKIRFINTGHNADIENLYVLANKNTASASEITIVGLKPYMNVKQIGENTHGKYAAMYVYAGEELGNWLIAPIVCKYANAEGYTDFKNGLEPDYNIEPDFVSGYRLCDMNDPYLATAIDLIRGDDNPLSAKAAHKSTFKIIGGKKSLLNNNAYVLKKSIN